jgi:hypothetical protein
MLHLVLLHLTKVLLHAGKQSWFDHFAEYVFILRIHSIQKSSVSKKKDRGLLVVVIQYFFFEKVPLDKVKSRLHIDIVTVFEYEVLLSALKYLFILIFGC